MQQCGKCPDAVAQIHGGKEAPQLTGWVRFYQERECVLIEAGISGLPENGTGFFGFHIHQGQRCSGTDFSGTGSHYNPWARPHPLHAGDLPPLLGCHGNAYLSLKTNRFFVDEIIGRTVVIHSDSDDFRSQPAGNAGKKIACGEIRRAR